MAAQPIAAHYDVVIAGAGPAGCACALALKDAGLRVALLDKKDFPRDKVCGDAIPGRAIKTLRSIAPGYEQAFLSFPKKYRTKSTRLCFKGREMEFKWVVPAYTCARIDFDNFLFRLVKDTTGTHVFTNVAIAEVAISAQGVDIKDKTGNTICTAGMVVGADGAQSVLAKQLTARTMDRDHHVGSVRAYYQNVGNTTDSITEIYFDKRYLPSYLWVFPLPGNMANVGFGMLSSEIAKRKINIRNTFFDFIASNPELKVKFANSTQVGELEGFGLPLGSRRVVVSGERFVLAGDAASLIDPISGDGIGNAMLSGKLAAEQAKRSFITNDFSAPAMIKYDDALFAALGSELQSRFKAQRLLAKMPWLLDVMFWVGRNKSVSRWVQKRF